MNTEQKLVYIGTVISSELFRPILIKSMLSQEEVCRLITKVAFEVFNEFEGKVSEQDMFTEAIKEAKIKLFENHNIKL